MLNESLVPKNAGRLLPRHLLLALVAGVVLPAGAGAQTSTCWFGAGLNVLAPSTVSAGVPFNLTVTPILESSDGQYLDFSSTDPDANLPAMQATNVPETVRAVLQTPGAQTICVIDTDGETGGVSINVVATSHVTALTSSVNFGSLAIGTASAAQAVSFSIASPGNTVGSIGILTQGAASMDFTQASGSTCTAETYTTTTTCTVNVIFKPKAAGLRLGAVVFFSKAGNTGIQLANVPIYGVGTGPQIGYGPGTWTAIDPEVNGASLNYPLSVAVDGAGELLIGDLFRVVRLSATGRSAIAISPTVGGFGLDLSWGLAVDGAGDVLVSNSYWNVPQGQYSEPGSEVMVAPSGGSYAKAILPVVTSGNPHLFVPTGVAVDGAGDVFIADSYNNRVLEVPAGGGAATVIDPTVTSLGLNSPYGVALDAAGDLFIADNGNNRVVEVPAGGGTATAIAPAVDGLALNGPVGVALDAAGDLFIADSNNNRVVEIPAGGGAAIALAPVVNGLGLSSPQGVAVDDAGGLFIADSTNNRVLKWTRSQPPEISFPTVTSVGSTDTADGTETVQIFNVGNGALDFTALTYPADFSEAGGDASVCSSVASLNPGEECDVPIAFTPMNIPPSLVEDVKLTDNALNEAGAQQFIEVTGKTRYVAGALSLPVPGSVLKGPEVLFSWSAVPAAVAYSLWIGTTGAGSNNFFDSGELSTTSVKVAYLPSNGETLYVRLNTIFSKSAFGSNTTYIATTKAAILSPESGTQLAGPKETFTWAAVPGASGYSLWIGSTGPGSSDLYVSHETTGTSATAEALPTNGETIYARLYTTYGNVTLYSDSTYQAQ